MRTIDQELHDIPVELMTLRCQKIEAEKENRDIYNDSVRIREDILKLQEQIQKYSEERNVLLAELDKIKQNKKKELKEIATAKLFLQIENKKIEESKKENTDFEIKLNVRKVKLDEQASNEKEHSVKNTQKESELNAKQVNLDRQKEENERLKTAYEKGIKDNKVQAKINEDKKNELNNLISDTNKVKTELELKIKEQQIVVDMYRARTKDLEKEKENYFKLQGNLQLKIEDAEKEKLNYQSKKIALDRFAGEIDMQKAEAEKKELQVKKLIRDSNLKAEVEKLKKEVNEN